MSLTSDLEEKYGLKIDRLNAVEKETYFQMLESVQKAQMTSEKLREYIDSMRDAVAMDLAKEPNFIRIFIFKVENPKIIQLQARLLNYTLLLNFLLSPEKAKQQLEDMVAGMGKPIVDKI